MTQEHKELLIKDLCSRLPYGVKVTWDDKYPLTITPHIYCAISSEHNIDSLPKLLLRPMSSMTEEESNEFQQLDTECDKMSTFDYVSIEHYRIFDWLNAHHFDYRGLIEKGLAIDCTGLNIY